MANKNCVKELEAAFSFYGNTLPEKEICKWIEKNIDLKDFRSVANQIITYQELCHKVISVADVDQVLTRWRRK
ncbi:MAG: hypothetical protein SPL22_02420 [Treponema sp.]|uniref:hypothetical protein n=1 Tax=Treponema sp. TaxID=166 RepID=UPI002A909739|nr:hypothetical protein [Treponema sp.]MDY6396559.1 hypothetical protein [Treponema sp.]